MAFYSPSSLYLGYPSYTPRRSYRPTSFYQYDGEPSGLSTFGVEDLDYSPLAPAFPPRVDAETRYRRALHELEAAEQEFEAHVALERARRVALVRQRAAAEAARRERARAIQAEVERLERTRALQALAEERLAQRQHSFRPRAAFRRVPSPGHDFLRGLGDLDTREDFVPHRRFPGCRRSRSQVTHCPTRDNEDVFTIEDLLKFLAGVHPEPEPASPTQEPTSAGAGPEPESQPQSQSQPAPPKPDDGEVTFNNILEFFHSIASQARDAAAEYQSGHEPNAPSHPKATPAEEKGKGKAKAEPVSEPTLLQTLFGERMNGALNQEMRDLEQAIKLSLQDRDASDAKKAGASKTSRSSPGASSSKVKIEEPSSHSGRAASPARGPASTFTPASVPHPPSPLTTIRAVRSRFSKLESAFKFPPVLDFDHSELAVSPNNAPVRAYEQTLNGLLEQLDAIESDGDEEVRDARREVVREVERALEDVELEVKKRAPREVPVPEVSKEEVNGYDVGNEELEAASQDVLLADIAPDVEDVKPTPPDLARTACSADADVDLAISEEYPSASSVVGSSEVVGSAASPPSPSAEEAPSTLDATDAETEVTPAAFGNNALADSTATITSVTPAVAPVPNTPAHPSPDPETFLTSLSHEHFTFPPKPASRSQSSATAAGEARDDDAVLVDDSSEGGFAKGADDGWSEVDA